jgi:DNA gyrase inhibitor GyrI
MNLTKVPQTVIWPETHYIFIEKVGPFMETAKPCWNELFRHVAELKSQNECTAFFSLYKFKPDTYRAGMGVAAKPGKLPPGMAYELFQGGKYAKFVLTGSYSQLPEACGLVFEKYIPEQKLKMRDAWCIENYTNDPQVTAEKDLVTEILIPV